MSIEAGEEAAKQISARHASTQPVDTRSSRMRDTVALHRARANEKARLLALEIPTRREMERDACLLLETRRAHQEHFDTGARNTRGAYRNTAGSLYSSPRAPRGSRLPAPPPPTDGQRAATARLSKGGQIAAQLDLETPAWIHQVRGSCFSCLRLSFLWYCFFSGSYE